ncbi:RND transporter [Mammaliicoccus sciuri]|uniref:RND transporter n=1 Tax=Sporosarcina newyorkensis TaxID=759851 RepID=A0A1T4XJN6_9BACL|nr:MULTISPECIES: RND transporter [Sporosarcina]MBY0223898.1 RND transporter [Sporosarcina aquimarina]SKA89750.1 hypothetical protein SAMN04244570_0877 [Sporosarcina newyorkensis]
MINKRILKTINWFVFISLVLIGVITAVFAFLDINSTSHSFDADQSRAEFRWSSIHTAFSVVLILLLTFLGLGWKRLFPFNVPIALIIAGLLYSLFFLTFTVGWVGMVGLLGLAIAIVVGMILIIVYSVYLLNEKRKRSSNNT